MSFKVLTVDDSKTIRLIVAKAFKQFDCQILEGTNGVEGLAVATRERPDVIILDLTMPVMDGLEMLTKLKSDPDLKNIPVIMLTAEGGRETVLKIAKMGVRDYLIKPFKEDLIVERVGAVIDLKSKDVSAARVRCFDEPLTLLVVDDKPAIADQIRAGLADLPWRLACLTGASAAAEYCGQQPVDLVLINLSLPDQAAYWFLQQLRAASRTKAMPVFGLCVKTAAEEQSRAQQSGFTGVVTKPIDFADLKTRIARALNLDTSGKFFQVREGVLVFTPPAEITSGVADEIAQHLHGTLGRAVDGGIDKLVLDLSRAKTADLALIRIGLAVIQVSAELKLKHAVIGSAALNRTCQTFEETRSWRFVTGFAEALAGLGVKLAAAA